MKILKRKTLAALLALSLLASLLPLGAQPALAAAPENQVIYVGGVEISSTGYWTTDSEGNVSSTSNAEQPSSGGYIHYNAQTNTLTLHNATIKKALKYGNNPPNSLISGAAIGVLNQNGDAALTIQLEGDNTIENVDAGISVLAHSPSNGDARLTITSESGGSLKASGSVNSGILVQSNSGDATLRIENAEVTTTSSSSDGVLVRAKDGSNASLTVNGGSLTATGKSEDGAGIRYTFGGAISGSGKPSLNVSGNAIVKANGGEGGISTNSSTATEIKSDSEATNGGIVFDNGTGTVCGAVTLQEDLEIGEGESLTIPNGSSLNTDDKLTVDGGTLNGTPSGDVTYKVTKVELSTSTLALTEGGSETLTATITPDNASNKSLTWSSDNQSVATVSDGVVTAVSPGSAKITATADGKSDTCTVTVTAKTYSLSVDPATLDFGSITEGDAQPAAQTVTITNTGNQAVTLNLPTAENFEIGALSKTELAPNATATFTIQPKDKLPRGSYSEQITITGDNNVSATLTATFTVKEPPYTGKYSYELTTSVGDHGSLTVDRYATEGEKVTITISPDEAYLLDDLTVTSGGKDVALTDNGDGTFSFTMPSADVKITATFAKDPDWTEPEEPATDVSEIFIDIAANAWYKDAVQYAYAGGLMTGVSANEFAPEATTTRAMIVSMLARLEGVESAESAGFADVAANDWYATAVNWAAASGITSGTGDGNFSPNTAITREQLAAILMNYAQYKGQDVSARATLDTYNDATAISSWANDVMSWAVAEGLLTGVTNDQLQPQGNATRAQVAAILQRFLAQ